MYRWAEVLLGSALIIMDKIESEFNESSKSASFLNYCIPEEDKQFFQSYLGFHDDDESLKKHITRVILVLSSGENFPEVNCRSLRNVAFH